MTARAAEREARLAEELRNEDSRGAITQYARRDIEVTARTARVDVVYTRVHVQQRRVWYADRCATVSFIL